MNFSDWNRHRNNHREDRRLESFDVCSAVIIFQEYTGAVTIFRRSYLKKTSRLQNEQIHNDRVVLSRNFLSKTKTALTHSKSLTCKCVFDNSRTKYELTYRDFRLKSLARNSPSVRSPNHLIVSFARLTFSSAFKTVSNGRFIVTINTASATLVMPSKTHLNYF